MAKLYNHGHKVADFAKASFTTYRLMSDGKWMKKRSGWKLAHFKEGVNPLALLLNQKFTVTIYDAEAYKTYSVPLTEPKADDACEACGREVANRECAHGILCDACDEAVHGEIDGPCELESK